jgi:hypothetical protein
VLLTKLDHLADPGYRQPRLHGTRLVVQTAVQNPAVVAALMLPDRSFLFEDTDCRAGESLTETIRCSQADDSAADD